MNPYKGRALASLSEKQICVKLVLILILMGYIDIEKVTTIHVVYQLYSFMLPILTPQSTLDKIINHQVLIRQFHQIMS